MPDDVLVQRGRRGDRAAFRALYERYNRRAFALAFGVVHDRDDALDVVQEAFLKAHRNLQGFEGSASFYTWLYRIVMNVAIDMLRRKGRGHTVDFDDAVAYLDGEVASGDPTLMQVPLGQNPMRELMRQEAREKIDAALGKLSANHRAVMILREIDGLSYEEIAKVMGCSKGTVMSRLFYARRYMQKLLAEMYGEPRPAEAADADAEEEES